MGSYIARREQFLARVLELHQSGMGHSRISKIIPVPEETIRRWIRKFATNTASGSNQMKSSTPKQQSSANVTEDFKALQRRNKELEAQLKRETLRADFYDEMINVAEAKFNIPIRKKAGAKQ